MKGILFTKENIDKTVNGNKTQTRRLSGLENINKNPDRWRVNECFLSDKHEWCFYLNEQPHTILKPRYLPGETVYLKESHYVFGYYEMLSYKTKRGLYATRFVRVIDDKVYYDDNKPEMMLTATWDGTCDVSYWYKRSPLFMESKDARHLIRIKDATPQRLQDITEMDCFKEGIDSENEDYIMAEHYNEGCAHVQGGCPARFAFICLWDSINAKKSPWSKNDWVWKYEYELVK